MPFSAPSLRERSPEGAPPRAAPTPKNRVLLVIHVNTYFVGLLPVARLLKRSTHYAPVFLFCRDYPALQGDLEACRTEGLPFVLGEDVSRGWMPAAKGG